MIKAEITVLWMNADGRPHFQLTQGRKVEFEFSDMKVFQLEQFKEALARGDMIIPAGEDMAALVEAELLTRTKQYYGADYGEVLRKVTQNWTMLRYRKGTAVDPGPDFSVV